ncbi:MAG: substrate-binding domain-containing protein [Lachnospiraceae bacterium]|nr:substrate-binding domain-containing protein [Lachnospiraceae bacterium]
MAVTIKQIAEVAQVSRGTVDRALNHRPGVKAEVAARVRRIADDLGYKPDVAARSLASKRYVRKKIGILLCSEGNPFFEDVLQGINNARQELNHLGVESEVKSIKGFDAQAQIEKIEEFVREGVNGIVLTPVNTPEVAEALNRVIADGIHIVTINTDIPGVKKMAYVGCDYVTGGCVGGELLGMMSNGLTEKVVIVIGSRRNLAHEQRLRGIRRTLKKDFSNITVEAVLENEDDDEKCYDLVSALLKEKKDLTGICFAAAGVEGGIRAVREAGLERKLQIVAYDLTGVIKENMKNGTIAATVCQEPYQQGYNGVDILGKYLLSGQRPSKAVINTHVYIATKYNI